MIRTRALLLSDVVDSTALVQQLDAAGAAALWARHDRLARDLLPRHRGREIDKTDGFLLLFEDVADAAAYALAYHRALRELSPPLRARVGVHVGPVVLTENLPDDVARGAKLVEVDGIAKPVAARVMAVAGGGQTLLTGEAVAALVEPPARLVSHGHWHLKGVSEPVALFELGEADAPFTPPADAPKAWRVVHAPGDPDGWTPARDVPNTLPAERDGFVGRREDLDALARRFDEDARLVTIVGAGGTGKTRLALRYARRWLGDFPGGAWFCDLTEARDADGIVSAVARSLGVPGGPGDLVDRIAHALATRGRCLVVLDNFEQVARHAHATLGRWLDRAAEARCIVTSREILGLPGESVLALAPLDDVDAVALFVARARQARPDFAPGDADRAALADLVQLLDRLPLAIELAAARARAMPITAIAQRMNERFRLLAAPGGRASRQATLRGTLDWSWELLTADERAALAQLSVFEGGFTLDAAEAVLAPMDTWAADAVQALVDKSLARVVDGERYGFLLSVHEYGASQLEGASRGGAEERHGAWFAAFGAPGARAAARRSSVEERHRVVGVEADNLAVACRRAIARGDAPVAAATALALWSGTSTSAPPGRVAELLAAARAIAPPDATAVTLDTTLAGVAGSQGRFAVARERAAAAMALATALGLGPAAARARLELGVALRDEGDLDRAAVELEGAREEARTLADPGLLCDVTGALGGLCIFAGRFPEARDLLEEAVSLAERAGEAMAEANYLANLALVLHELGHTDRAMAIYDRALARHRALGNRRSEAVVLANLGNMHQRAGRWEEARALLEQSIVVWEAIGGGPSAGAAITNLAALHVVLGRRGEARRLYDRAVALARGSGGARPLAYALWFVALLDLEEGDLDAAAAGFEAARAAFGHDLGLLAGTTAGLAHVALRRGEVRAALAMLRAVPDEATDHFGLQAGLASALAELGDLAAARSALQRARASTLESPEDVAIVDAAEALVLASAGDAPGRDAAIARAMADPLWARPGSEAAWLVERALSRGAAAG